MSLKAKVGDLIQYRFKRSAFAGRDTRRVEMVDAGGYRVEGGFRVKRSDVLCVIPMTPELEGVSTESNSDRIGRAL